MNQVRIIGGKWRSRKVQFPDSLGLRPTPDRVRETLFNWLAPYIVGARCLDLFAGSGALGFEALSREAFQVVALEQNPLVIKALNETAQKLEADQIDIIGSDALLWLEQPGTPFDIVFVDPPFKDTLLRPAFSLLEANGWLNTGSFIYFESPVPIKAEALPTTWHLLREKKAGKLYYHLAQKLV